MDILITGGTGNISWRLTHAALAIGWNVTLLNRSSGSRARRPPPLGCRIIEADLRDVAAIEEVLGEKRFNAVVDFICYNGEQAQQAINYFRKRTDHYIFISSTAVYDRRAAHLPYVEATSMVNEGWPYALAKVQAERIFREAWQHDGFPVTVLRPGHTYDSIIPDDVGESDWTNPWRILNGKPVVLHGDGAGLWTLTHSRDFANGVIAFLQSGREPGDVFHVTSDETHSWNEITAMLYKVIGANDPQVCYRTVEEIDHFLPRIGDGLKFHKMWNDVYDNAKFKNICPAWRARVGLEEGLKKTVGYYKANPSLMVPNVQLDAVLDALCDLR